MTSRDPLSESVDSVLAEDVVLSAEHVSKKFCRNLRRSLAYGVKDLSLNMLGMKPAASDLRRDEFWALDDVSFELKRGEALGVIGSNGAGKSTLLRILTGILPPDRGTISIRGRVSGLIALGVGMHPHMTGRENIFLNGAILGMSHDEIADKCESIIKFSELGEFIDAPFATYSSGMRVRLGFAVAIHIQPDILVIDEVLAVGDQRFRRKARNAMSELLEKKTALIFISHNIHEVIGITERTLLLDKGKILEDGESSAICTDYLYRSSCDPDTGKSLGFMYLGKRTGDLAVKNVKSSIGDSPCDGRIAVDGPESEITLDIEMHASAPIRETVHYCISVKTLQGENAGYINIAENLDIETGSDIERRIKIETNTMQPGQYLMGFEIGTDGGPLLEGISNLVEFEIKPRTWLMSQGNGEGTNFVRMAGNQRGSFLLPVTFSKEGQPISPEQPTDTQ